ncbi:MAG TPA: efflux RND transporter periplasmic adaptor subunit [Bryobacteraceae bacterium]|nr:efflux RND transporter periplasmic adaptor subunit [Bryobacteraceae bacterium]
MKRLLWLLPLLAIGGGVWYLVQLRNAPPEISFIKGKRETLVSAIATNGKVEPLEWTAIRSEREGSVTRVAVEKGQSIAQGSVIAELDSADVRIEVSAAEARIAQAKADLDLLEKGGRARDVSEINSALEKLKADVATAQRQQESLKRLVDKKAAPAIELEQSREKIEALQAESRSLERRRESLVSAQETAGAAARLREAEATAATARRRMDLGIIRAPIAGTLYQLDIRKGAYVRAGDPVAQIGRLDRVRVMVYVDEPELGNIRAGLPVKITWDALPSRQWSGVVERLPAQIVALQSRQVGEVACIIDNPEQLLLPQTNVNAEIRTNVVENAITIPKEVLRRQNNEAGVYVLMPDNLIAWRKVRLGASSVTRWEVKDGLKEQDVIALPTDIPLREGMLVKPVISAGP